LFLLLLLRPLSLLLRLLFLSLSTIKRKHHPVQDAPLLEIREDLPEGQDPSPSFAAFNKSFGTSYRGELLSVGYKAVSIGGDTSKILTLWKSSTLVDETGERA
jgi:hypothetical protein